jgi:hypothetical protein
VSRFPLFWSNVQTVLAAMYGQIPKVEVDRANSIPRTTRPASRR